MAPAKKTKKEIASYAHKDEQRVNNPPVGLVTPETDADEGKKGYTYDPHLDPQLVWAGKAERTSFEVPTVSLHVHERIDPRTIIEAVRRHNGADDSSQLSLFSLPEENPPLRHAVEFYQHKHNWSNRLIAGDSLLVMNSLIEKEGMAGKAQMVYIDPPYGITYGSNFQPFVNMREVRDGKDSDLTAEPEQIRAFRDTWELGIHSYLNYLRDRLLLARDLLTESGSVFVQIGDENVHLVSLLLDEIYGRANRIATISFATTSGSSAKHLPEVSDFLLWYAKDAKIVKYHQLFETLNRRELIDYMSSYARVELPDGTTRKLTAEERFDPDSFLPEGAKLYRRVGLDSQGVSTTGRSEPYVYQGTVWHCAPRRQWSISQEGLDRLAALGRLDAANSLMMKRYEEEIPGRRINNIWRRQMYPSDKTYVVQTARSVISRCMLMSTDPGDLVFDPTCGSGTTAYVAERWGRRWITCDTSRVALTLAKQRLMTACFDYYELAHPDEGVGSGFRYKTIPVVSARSLAYAEPQMHETLYDQPLVDRSKTRVAGPFTVEAVPAAAVRSVDEVLEDRPQLADSSIARVGETRRQSEWRDELLKVGIHGKAGQRIRFARLEPLPGVRYLHAHGETLPNADGADGFRENGAAAAAQPIVVAFGPEHAPLEQRQVAQAIEEAWTLVPKPKVVVFAAFQFDPEAAKDIDETKWPGVTLLKAQMNADLLTDDLKKKSSGNESFWMIGQPDVAMEQIAEEEDKGKYRVSVHGFDYYNTRTGNVESGGQDKIAVWMLDTDYDGRSVFPRQVFFPMAGPKDGWARLAKNLKAEVDEELIEAYRGTVSLPFAPGENRRVAVKIVDDRGIESLKVVEIAEFV